MRIIGGKHKGRHFTPPSHNPARPTTDYAKEGLFNIINNTYNINEVKFLDLFAGTGSISYEFASRGCIDIDAVELYGPNVHFIKKTAQKFNFNINVFQQDVFQYIRTCREQYDIIFAGPPYSLHNVPDIPSFIFQYMLLSPEAWFILETNTNHNFDDHDKFLKKRNYGTTVFHFFEEAP